MKSHEVQIRNGDREWVSVRGYLVGNHLLVHRPMKRGDAPEGWAAQQTTEWVISEKYGGMAVSRTGWLPKRFDDVRLLALYLDNEWDSMLPEAHRDRETVKAIFESDAFKVLTGETKVTDYAKLLSNSYLSA